MEQYGTTPDRSYQGSETIGISADGSGSRAPMAPPPWNTSEITGQLTRGIRRRSLLAGVAALGAAGALGAATGCSQVDISGATDGGHLLEDLRRKGTVRMGIASEPPYASINSKGELTGEAPAVAK